MKINILSQGITPDIDNSVGSVLIKFLSSDEYHSFTGISAFASKAGIYGLSQYIEKAKTTYKNLNILTGIDQKGTSKEALYAMLNLGINTYIFYQTAFSIFHPKIYLFEGEHFSQLIIGSSNLTSQGLFANVEASIHLELLNHVEEDMKVITELKQRFQGLFDFSDPNVKCITSELIEQLVAEKIVPTEAERKEIQDKREEFEGVADETIERLIRKIFPQRQLPVIPSNFRGIKKSKLSNKEAEDNHDFVEDSNILDSYKIVWRCLSVPASSVEMVRPNTNPTGRLKLVQSKFQVNGKVIDQTRYFRNDVFAQLDWVTEKISSVVEVAIAQFEVIVLGEDWGSFALKIKHNPSGEAGQRNYTTSISWGELSKEIQKKQLVNRQLNIYSLEGSTDAFKLEIV